MLIAAGLLANVSIAEENPIRWSSGDAALKPIKIFAESNLRTVGRQVELEVTVFGRLPEASYLYSTEHQGESGPIPSSVELENPLFSKTGAAEESETVGIADGTFGRPLKVHRKEFQIRQRFKAERLPNPAGGILAIGGYLLYQQCTEKICSLPTKSAFDLLLTIPD